MHKLKEKKIYKLKNFFPNRKRNNDSPFIKSKRESRNKYEKRQNVIRTIPFPNSVSRKKLNVVITNFETIITTDVANNNLMRFFEIKNDNGTSRYFIKKNFISITLQNILNVVA